MGYPFTVDNHSAVTVTQSPTVIYAGKAPITVKIQLEPKSQVRSGFELGSMASSLRSGRTKKAIANGVS